MTDHRKLAALTLLLAICVAGCSTSVADTPTTSTATATPSPNLPPMKHFRIGGDVYGPVTDCRVADTAVTCTSTWDDPYQADTYTGTFTGTLSGSQMTGTFTTHQTGHDASDPGCRWETETSAPLTYIFNPDGTVSDRQDPGQWRMTKSGSCTGTETGTTSAGEGGAVRWTVVE